MIYTSKDIPEGGKPMSRVLEDYLLHLAAKGAPNYLEVCATDRAPLYLSALVQTMIDYIDEDTDDGQGIGGTLRENKYSVKGVRVPVRPRKSRGIWSSPEARMMIEGLVRSYHVSNNAELDSEGVLKVYSQLMIHFPEGPERTILRAFLVAPYLYKDKHGTFPRVRNQRAFVRDCMIFGIEEVLDLGLHH
jgi:hypothetical protein